MSVRQLSPYSRRLIVIAVLFIVGCLIAAFGIMVTIKTDTLNAKTRVLKEKLSRQNNINEKLAAQILKEANLATIDNYATETLGMAPPKNYQVIIVDSE